MNIIKRYKKPLLNLLVIFFVVFGLIFSNLSRVYTLVNNLAQTHPRLFQAGRSIVKLTDIPFRLVSLVVPDRLPQYSLILDPQDLDKLNSNLPQPEAKLTDEYKKAVPAAFIFDNTEYPVEVRYRGDNANHWAFPKKSWRINFTDQPFQGMQTLDLIIPEDRGYVQELTMAYLADQLKLSSPQMQLVNLFVNQRRQGVYLATEHWSQAFLEIRGQAGTNNLYGENDFNYFFPGSVYYSPAQLKPFYTDELSNLENTADLGLFTNLMQIKDQNHFLQSAEQIIDMDNFLRWQAHSTLMFSQSQKDTHNLILNFNSQLGKFEFIPWNVTMTIKDVNAVPINIDYNQLMTRILKDDTLYAKRNQILWDFVSNDQNLESTLAFIDQTIKTASFDIYKGALRRFTVAEFLASTSKFKSQIKKAFAKIKLNSQQGQIAVFLYLHPKPENYADNISYLDIENRGFSPTQITEFEFEFSATPSAAINLYIDKDNDKNFSASDPLIGSTDKNHQFMPQDLIIATRVAWDASDLKASFTPIPDRRQRIFIQGINADQIIDLKLKTRNAATGEKSQPFAIRLIDEATFRYLSLSNISQAEFLRSNPQFIASSEDSNTVILPAGTHYFRSITIVPSTVKFKIQPGARLLFAPQISLLSYAPVIAQGTAENPIIITSASASPFGVLAIIGRHNQSNIFEYVQVSNGSEAYLNGVYISGALAIHYADAEIKNCTFKSNIGDDGLNIKHGQAFVTGSLFQANHFDGLDLDIVTGKVESNRFINNGNDGLDISFSDVKITNNLIDFNGDKCVSIGEKSSPKLVDNIISNCVMGVAAKDLSKATLENNTFDSNQTAIAAYQKREIFGGAQVVEINNTFLDNLKDFDISENSKIAHE